ncbi:MAG TPA: class I SAM-dependent methyltransferase [Bacillota bacterium]|nr:class I SAM-dependent methyltransferase [Bacillota bacterium]
MFKWDLRMIQFMKDAIEENDIYFKSLAGKVSEYLPADAHVCDAGCGLGYLSTELSKYCRNVTAVDIASLALVELRNKLNHINCNNIKIVEGDIRVNPPGIPYDAMVFCLFSSLEDALKISKEQCRGTTVMIKRNWNNHLFSISQKALERHTLQESLEHLKMLRIPYKSENFILEMGQPFRSMADAVEFFQMYSNDDYPHEIKAEDIADRLVYRESDRFPYYLPALRQLGIIVVKTSDIPDNIEIIWRRNEE